MSASTRRCNPAPVDPLHARFLVLLPRIELHARVAFRGVRCPDRKADAIAEAVALAWAWFVRLAARGKDAGAFVTALATYAARAVKTGRRLCGQQRAKDALSPVAQRKHGFAVEPLPVSTCTSHDRLYATPHGQRRHDAFEDRLRDNTRTPPDEQAAFRIDFPAWLATLAGRDRRVVAAMTRNERTKDLSRQFNVSQGRISQLRREFHAGWLRYHGEPAEAR